MAHYTGSANDFAELLAALRNACVAEGWALTGNVLSKGAAFIKIEDITLDANTPRSLMLTGGTGLSGTNLLQPSAVTPRMGRGHNNAAAYVWPMSYHIHIHTNPDEVYFVANWSIEYFMWLAFGISDVPGLAGTGLWLTANAMRQYNSGYLEPVSYSYSIYANSGGSGPGYNSYYRNTGPFWRTNTRYSAGAVSLYGKYYQDAVHTGLNSLGADGWAGVPTATGSTAPGNIDAILAQQPHMARQPSAWNNEAILLPIQVYELTSSNKRQLIVDVRHARYLRIDNYEPGQVITLGPDRWRVYPFWRKNIAQRDGGGNLEHTGTFGWAIRYDGA